MYLFWLSDSPVTCYLCFKVCSHPHPQRLRPEQDAYCSRSLGTLSTNQQGSHTHAVVFSPGNAAIFSTFTPSWQSIEGYMTSSCYDVIIWPHFRFDDVRTRWWRQFRSWMVFLVTSFPITWCMTSSGYDVIEWRHYKHDDVIVLRWRHFRF